MDLIPGGDMQEYRHIVDKRLNYHKRYVKAYHLGNNNAYAHEWHIPFPCTET